jgi:phenylalanyl-tRNA synthetase beta chain
MIINLKLLSKFVDLSGLSVEDILTKLNSIGLETETSFNLKDELANIVIAKIIETKQHPDADKLKVCRVFDGQDEYQIVCGATNARAGIYVAMAKVDAYIRGADFKIKKSKIRGFESQGMLCSLDELDLGTGQGIWESRDEIELGREFSEYLGIDDVFIDIALTPNKGDCASILGVARELSVAFNKSFKIPNLPNLKSTFKSETSVRSIDDMSFYAIELKNIENKTSPDWLKVILHLYGCKPNNPVVDILNYSMYLYGQPMHSYDAKKIDGGLFLNYAKGDFTGLDGNKYVLDDKMLLVSDSQKPVCIAGVIGGENSKTDMLTSSVLLEAVSFKKQKIAYSSQKLNCKTQSSFRFERGIDPLMTKLALSMAVDMILNLCGGECSFYIEDIKPLSESIVVLDTKEIRNIIGENIEDDFIFSVLQKLGFRNKSKHEYIIPSHRHDVFNNADLAEEVGRFYGYDNIKAEPSLSFINLNRTYSDEDKFYNKLMNVRKILTISGLNEQVNFSFIDSELVKKFNLCTQDGLFLLNSHSSVMNYMRPNLIIGLLENANNNFHIDKKLFGCFETGLCFSSSTDDGQKTHISGIRMGVYKQDAFSSTQENNLLAVKKDILNILEAVYSIDLEKLTFAHVDVKYAHPYNVFGLFYKDVLVAQFGEIHPEILSANFKNIKNTVGFFEVFPDSIPSIQKSPYIDIKIQPIIREFSFIVDRNVSFKDLKAIVSKACNKHKHKLLLNEVYQGDRIPKDKKSTSLELILYPNVVLEKFEIDKIQSEIISLVLSEIGGIIRDGFQAR